MGVFAVNFTENELILEIEKIMMRYGVDPSCKGFKYIRDIMKDCIFGEQELYGVLSKKIYPKIALKYDTTPPSVERCVRYAISKAFENKEIYEKYQSLSLGWDFGTTNSQFLHALSYFVRKEMMTKE